jgi:hypothetical protein
MSNVPAGATMSEDGHYWWDGTAWQPVHETAAPAGQAADPAHRQTLLDGATNEAGRRLEMIRDDVVGAVSSFNTFAHDDVEDLHGKPESDIGLGLFKALVDVVCVASGIEEAVMTYKLAAAAMKGFIDTFSEEINKLSAQSAAGRLDEAKSELRRIIRDLSDGAADAAKAAQERAEPLLGSSAGHALDAHPAFLHLEASQDTYAAIADAMAVPDPRVSMLSHSIYSHLLDRYAHEKTRVMGRERFYDMDNDTDRLLHLLEVIEPTTPVHDYLTYIQADVPYWERRVQLFHDTFGTDINAVSAFQVIQQAAMSGD